jgi:hypothetical protein
MYFYISTNGTHCIATKRCKKMCLGTYSFLKLIDTWDGNSANPISMRLPERTGIERCGKINGQFRAKIPRLSSTGVKK